MEITWEVFLENIIAINKLSTKIYDNWVYKEVKSFFTDNSIYLMKTKQKLSTNNLDVLNYEYHVVFDPIYCVPKLCFNIFKTDGTLLTLDECLCQFTFEKEENTLQILTQMDHPILQRPFFSLHPCKTADLIQQIGSQSKNIVVTWLSTIGPSVGLNMDIEYSTLT